jgi:hypothetical protein
MPGFYGNYEITVSASNINPLTYTDVTFKLTAAGYYAGIVSGPVHPGLQFHITTKTSTRKRIGRPNAMCQAILYLKNRNGK